jgi:UDP-glucose 4-epimerase
MVIPNFVRQAVADEPLTVFGDGTQSRCFCHVSDVVRARADLMRRDDAYGEVFNIGSDEEISILDLAREVQRMTESKSEITIVPYEEAYEPGFEDMQRRIPDTSKIRSLLGWHPTKSLAEILSDVIDEHRRGARV